MKGRIVCIPCGLSPGTLELFSVYFIYQINKFYGAGVMAQWLTALERIWVWNPSTYIRRTWPSMTLGSYNSTVVGKGGTGNDRMTARVHWLSGSMKDFISRERGCPWQRKTFNVYHWPLYSQTCGHIPQPYNTQNNALFLVGFRLIRIIPHIHFLYHYYFILYNTFDKSVNWYLVIIFEVHFIRLFLFLVYCPFYF